MKKMMFNDRYGLTEAVIEKRKTVTPIRVDMIGRRFSRLKVIAISHKGLDRKYYYKCQCDCGNITVVRSNALTCGNIKSCGCLSKGANKTHGKTKTRLYRIWSGIKTRCCNNTSGYYDRYGGRGITICDDWNADFMSFYNWAINNGYNTEFSIDRIDNNGNYCPENCRWATPQQQSDNKRDNVLITINNETYNLQQWCNKLNINRSTVITRVRTCGWSYKKALTTPIRMHKEYELRKSVAKELGTPTHSCGELNLNL